MDFSPALVLKALGEKFESCCSQRPLNWKEQKFVSSFDRILREAVYDEVTIESDEDIVEEREEEKEEREWREGKTK